MTRFYTRFRVTLDDLSVILEVLTGVASIVCIVALIVYCGYNLKEGDILALRHMLRAAQIVFVVNILYRLIFFTRQTVTDNRIIKWIVDIGVLVSFILWIVPEVQQIWPSVLGVVFKGNHFLFPALGAYSIVDLCYSLSRIPGRRTNPSLLMGLSFLVFIIIGSFVLMLPKCTYHGISYFDSLFVSASAVSITGLTSVDIPSTFTPMGIIVLSVLIQLGSLGIITFTSFFALFFTGRTSIYNQLLLRDVVYSKSMNALVPTLLYVLGFTLTVELIGACFVYFTIPEALGLDVHDKLMFAAFHAMSSFCNAGFSCLPDGMANAVLMHSNQSIYIVTSVLIFAGAVGFPILVNFKEILRSYFKRLFIRLRLIKNESIPLHLFDLNTKLVLYTTLTVLGIGTVGFFILEYNNTLAGMSLYDKAVQSVFNSLVPRSAGFASVNPAHFLDLTLLLVLIQMFIGGSSQSMAGGIKVNTLATVVLSVRSVLYGHEGASAFNRTISRASVRRANAVVIIALGAFMLFLAVEMLLEPQLPTKSIIFEVASALFTVGSSLGITDRLGDVSKIVLSTAMFLGRVGIISILSGFIGATRDVSEHLPEESIIIN